MTSLSGHALGLLTNGADIGKGDRKSAVTEAMRSVMMSAQRAGWEYVDLHPYLTDTRCQRLAAQIAAGYGGRTINRRQRDDFMHKHWDETAKITAERPPWTHDDVLGAIELVRAALDTDDELGAQDRAVMDAVLDLADRHGITRVAAPARQVATACGITRMDAHRALTRLCERGEWLKLAKRGSPRSQNADGTSGAGRSNLYQLSPDLLRTYKGASPPTSQSLPMSHLPMSQGQDLVKSAVTYELTPAEDEAIAKVLEAIRIGAAGTTPEIRVTDQAGNVVQLDSRRRLA
jgi:hypothetical protein